MVSVTQTWADVGIDIRDATTGNVKTICPQCSPTRRHSRERCLSADVDRGLWKCHNCGWSGALSGHRAAPFGRREGPRLYAKPKPLAMEFSSTARAWFSERGISAEIIQRYQIRADGEIVAFPYFRHGEHINTKYRKLPKAFRMEKGAELIWYGLDDCWDAAQIVVVEGEMDKLACAMAGIVPVLSVPNGAQSGEMAFFESAAEIFAGAQSVILAVDNDGAGQKLETELARRIGREKCFRVTWPEGCKDANDTLIECGPEMLHACLTDARPYPVAGIVSPYDLETDYLALYHEGLAPGASTGWRSVDYLYTVKPGQMTIVTGIPGSGKSEWLDALMVNLARLHEWRFAVYSPENFPSQRHLAKWAEKYIGKPFGDGPTPRMSEAEARDALDWAARHLVFLIPDDTAVSTLLDLVRVEIFRSGVRGVVLDPWNEIDHSRPRELTETEYISRSLSEIRAFARLHEVHIWVLAHPRMLPRDKNGEYLVPGGYEISGSSHWFNKADALIAVWRNKRDDTAPVEIHVQKVRFREVGQLGTAGLKYEKATGRYIDIGEWSAAGGN